MDPDLGPAHFDPLQFFFFFNCLKCVWTLVSLLRGSEIQEFSVGPIHIQTAQSYSPPMELYHLSDCVDMNNLMLAK